MKRNIKFSILSALVILVACDPTSKWKSSNKKIENAKGQADLSLSSKEVLNYRDSINAMFMSGSNGVLPKGEVGTANELKHYAPNDDYKVSATYEPILEGKVFKMKTSSDRLPEYKPYGLLRFRLGDSSCVLTLYQNMEMPEHLFCPFKDLTNGSESYGGGRYLDFKLSDLVNPIIDFNYAYNPYCAYNPQYSCPIPPYENHLKIHILAGEKKWR